METTLAGWVSDFISVCLDFNTLAGSKTAKTVVSIEREQCLCERIGVYVGVG